MKSKFREKSWGKKYKILVARIFFRKIVPLTWAVSKANGLMFISCQLLQSEISVGKTNLITTSHYSGQWLIQLLTDQIITKDRKRKLGWTGTMSLPHLWLKYLCLFHTKSCTNIWKAFFVTGLTYKTTNKLANNARLDLTAEHPNY